MRFFKKYFFRSINIKIDIKILIVEIFIKLQTIEICKQSKMEIDQDTYSFIFVT